MAVRFAVVLSGCGVYDGSEIHEAVLSLLAIEEQGAIWQCFAPDISQMHVVNHITGGEMAETRNVLIESARISRGKILPLQDFSAEDFDILFFPGGFGGAKNLSTYALDGDQASVEPRVEGAILQMLKLGKPIGALCITPVILAKVIGRGRLTIGTDPKTADNIRKMGAEHLDTQHGQVVVDQSLKIVTAPCYMLDASIPDILADARESVSALLKLL